MADIAIITVNYGTANLALRAVESVIEQDHGGHDVEMHLVDNNSPDGDAHRIRETLATRGWTERVTFYAESENHGFGRGNNIVLSALAARPKPPDYVFLFNPDARLTPGAITELAAFLTANSKAAVVGAAIDRPNGGPSVSAAFRFPSIISEFETAARFGPISSLTRRWRVSLPPDAPTQQVDWVAGAALFGRFSALAEVGFFDPDFFLYFEETELMHRIKRAGWQVWYCREARIEHVAGAATGIHVAKREAMPDYWFDSWRFYFLKTNGLAKARVCAVSRLLGSFVHVGISWIRRRRPSHSPTFPSDFYRLAVRPLFQGERHGR
ncbi:MAG: glycosyltransferase family 2 protein [Pseudomonadota bacterium]